MPMTRDQILAAAMALEPTEREALAEELLLSLTASEREAIDAAWLSEARRREEAFARGEISTSTVDDTLDRIRARARQ